MRPGRGAGSSSNPCRGAYRCSSSGGSLRSPPANFLSPRWGGIRYCAPPLQINDAVLIFETTENSLRHAHIRPELTITQALSEWSARTEKVVHTTLQSLAVGQPSEGPRRC